MHSESPDSTLTHLPMQAGGFLCNTPTQCSTLHGLSRIIRRWLNTEISMQAKDQPRNQIGRARHVSWPHKDASRFGPQFHDASYRLQAWGHWFRTVQTSHLTPNCPIYIYTYMATNTRRQKHEQHLRSTSMYSLFCCFFAVFHVSVSLLGHPSCRLRRHGHVSRSRSRRLDLDVEVEIEIAGLEVEIAGPVWGSDHSSFCSPIGSWWEIWTCWYPGNLSFSGSCLFRQVPESTDNFQNWRSLNNWECLFVARKKRRRHACRSHQAHRPWTHQKPR